MLMRSVGRTEVICSLSVPTTSGILDSIAFSKNEILPLCRQWYNQNKSSLLSSYFVNVSYVTYNWSGNYSAWFYAFKKTFYLTMYFNCTFSVIRYIDGHMSFSKLYNVPYWHEIRSYWNTHNLVESLLPLTSTALHGLRI